MASVSDEESTPPPSDQWQAHATITQSRYSFSDSVVVTASSPLQARIRARAELATRYRGAQIRILSVHRVGE